jgi:hypothetical protein
MGTDTTETGLVGCAAGTELIDGSQKRFTIWRNRVSL